MRLVLIALTLAACEPPLRLRPLPELAARVEPQAIRVPALRLVPGESLIWDVHMGGFTIGRATLAVDADRVHSRFATSGIASSMSRVRHSLTTLLDRGAARPIHAIDQLDVDGEHTDVATVFDGARVTVATKPAVVPGGNVGHSLHSALGVLRAWAEPGAHAGYVYVVHAGEVFRLDFAQPHVEALQDQKTLRVECRVRGDTPFAMTIWLGASVERVPLRIEIRADDVRLTAELIAS